MTTDPLLRAFNDDGTEAALRTAGYREPILTKPVRASHEWEELDRTIEAIKQTTTRPEPAPLYQPHDACLDRAPHGTQPATVAPPADPWAPLWGTLLALLVGIPWLVGIIAICQHLRGQP